jgi:hypothetical protein
MADVTEMEPPETVSLSGTLDRLRGFADGDSLSVRDVVEGMGRASLLPLLLVPALVVVSPLSGIPLLSSICGLTIAIVATQLFFGAGSLWLPGWIMRRSVNARRMNRALDRIQPVARWLDAHAHSRLSALVVPPINLVPRLACILCGLSMPFLELVPFSSSILASAVVLIVLGFLARDGLYTLAGLAMAALGLSIPFFVITQATAL